MNGLTTAFTGRVGADPEQRYTMAGKQMLAFRVAVDENISQREGQDPTPPTWVRVTAWEEKAAELQERGLSKGQLVYCEGRLKLERWLKADGSEGTALALSAWVVQPMGQIGQRRAAPTREPVGAGAGANTSDLEDLPF
jgi:single-strand DNA-binding protein